MSKNIIKIGALACAMFFAVSATAQSTPSKLYGAQYPQYGFWSNWSLGAELGWSHQFGNGLGWTEGSDFGAIFSLEKELNYVWDFRLQGGAPAFMAHKDCADTAACPGGFDRYGKVTAGFKFGIIDAIKGYNPERRANLYLAADAGMAIKSGMETYGKIGLLADLGLGFSYKVCEHSTLFAEATLDAACDISDVKLLFQGEKCDYRSFIGLGYQFNFGPTAADLELIAMRAKLTQENFDAMNAEIERLNGVVADDQKVITKQQNDINDLNERLANAIKRADVAEAKCDSLSKVIDQMKADQYTYYALPFSILFDVDQYQIPADQQSKVKALARVMSDTEDAKFKVVGFCDKSGSDEWNEKLSKKRAESLKKALVKQGVAEDRIEIEYYGKQEKYAFGDLSFSVNRRASVYRVME